MSVLSISFLYIDKNSVNDIMKIIKGGERNERIVEN